ncbi:signal transducer and activator of transcription C-like isoform X1 [Drosophila subobscura]|uniref:signal transducer and activator of transcription C-like isoform X1 n=1 Tax=Drosophila subobscura TaxID=7241 RepID=UPI00155B2DAA|nr:signal transducer and activator of transcription C-like isoform X1 [Drosophila subobscura]
MSLLGLNKEQDSLQQPLGHVTRMYPQQQQPLKFQSQIVERPLPGQMPKLPQPPLFWQKEAQQQKQQAQQANRVQSQHCFKSLQTLEVDLRQKDACLAQQHANHQNQIQQRHSQQMPPHISPMTNNNGNQAYYNKQLGHEVYNNSNPLTTLEQKQYQAQHPQHLQYIVSSRPHYSSIKDFVPIQAYRPKISQRPQSIGQIEAEVPSSTTEGEVNSPN